MCTSIILAFKENRETGERESERESVGRKKLSRDSGMSVQRLTILIYYRTCAACSFQRFAYSIGIAAILFFFSANNSAYQIWCALALGVSPLPRVLWAVGGAFPGSDS